MVDALVLPSLNHLLAQHDWARRRLRAHAGAQVQVNLAACPLRFSINADGQLDAAHESAASDVLIEVPSSALAAIADGIDGVMAQVRLSGNAELADTLGFVGRHLRWDREADLARLFGPIVGRRVHLAAQSVERSAPALAGRLVRNASEYLVYEQALLVSRDALEHHLGATRRLRDDLARVAQRIDRLDKQIRD